MRLPAFLTETVIPETDVVEPQQVEVPAPRVAESADTGLTVVWPQPDPQHLAAARVSPAQTQRAIRQARAEVVLEHGPVEFDRVVPGSGIVEVFGKQFWLHTTRAGQLVTFWADTQAIHISVAGTRVKSARSHLSLNDLAVLTRLGARPAGPSPLPLAASGAPVTALELDRSLGTAGWVSVGNHIVKVNELGAGTRVGIRLDETTLAVFDLQTRELLRAGPNPLTPAEMLKLRGTRPAGPPPQPRTGPVTVQRRASNSGGICVCSQKIALGREHARKIVTVHVGQELITVELDDGQRTIRRTTTQPVSKVKAQRLRKVTVI